MTDEVFMSYVREGIDALPDWVQREIGNVIFLARDEATEEQRRENGLTDDEVLFGLYEGVPLTERGNDGVIMPDTITVFKRPILETYTNDDDVRTCIHNTVWHEVAHFFGYGEEWVEEEERRRGKTL